MIPATIGRVVWLWNAPRGIRISTEDPFAATIAYVNRGDLNDGSLNISYFDHVGCQHHASEVVLIQDGGTPPQVGQYCTWMPYQIGQAKQPETAPTKVYDRPPAIQS